MYNRNQHLHFVGIGGVGMAGIAEVLLNLGYAVSGSDLQEGKLTDHLSHLGARISIGHDEKNISSETSVTVISSAIRRDNPEIVAAEKLGIPVIPRAEMLAELMRMKYGVAIAGSHGKTTTTSMVAQVLNDSGLDSTVIIGGRVLTRSSGASVGRGNYLVAEADESDGSFCMLRPAISVVTNIDREHLGHYGSFGALEEAFFRFMSSVPFYGMVIICQDDSVLTKLTHGLKRRVFRYGLSPESELQASEITISGFCSEFTLNLCGKKVRRVSLPLPGVHMVSNALAAIAVGLELGISAEQACDALEKFAGVARRTEIIAERSGIMVVDDYAHHPTEIRATLAALRSAREGSMSAGKDTDLHGRTIVFFQPHRFSRTRELFSEFVNSFHDADEIIVGEIYPAREEPIPEITGARLAEAIQHPRVSFVSDLADAVDGVLPRLKPGDVVVTLGAGNVGHVAHLIAERLGKK